MLPSSCVSHTMSLPAKLAACVRNSGACTQRRMGAAACIGVVGLATVALMREAALTDARTWSTISQHVNFAKSYVGYGQCEPHDMPRVVHSFPPEQSSGIHWPGEEEFWSIFPCNRSEYRVVLPTPSEGNLNTGCGNTIATAWFDIGRSKWKSYSRSNEEYFNNLATVMALKNPMAVFTSPDLVQMIVDARTKHGLMDRTVVIGMSLHCTPIAHLHDYTRHRMCQPEYLRGALHPEVPERMHPWYNLIMWAKAYFFYATSLLPQIKGEYYVWLDAGCHDPMCSASMAGTCVAPAPHSRRDRVRIAQVSDMTPDTLSKDPVAFYKDKHVHFGGTIFGTGRDSVKMLYNLFLDALHWMLVQGAVDQDQSIFAYMFFKSPFSFDSYHTIDPWAEVVKRF